MSEPTDEMVEAALEEWMRQAAAFMFTTYQGVENQGEPWDTRKERLRPWMRSALTAASALVWQGIESAPTDDRQVLAGFMGQFGWFYFIAHATTHGVGDGKHAPPTYWSPLPAPPQKPT